MTFDLICFMANTFNEQISFVKLMKTKNLYEFYIHEYGRRDNDDVVNFNIANKQTTR